jgi:transposase-like protein
MRTIGIPGRKIKAIFEKLFGLRLTHTTVLSKETQLAEAAEPVYEGIKQKLRESEQIHIDETGWRTDGKNTWLWCFVNKAVAYFHIDKSRGRAVPESVLGEGYKGIVTSDFYSAYNKLPCGGRQRCVGHLLDELKGLEEASEGKEREFYQRLKGTLKSSVQTWRRFRGGDIDETEFRREREEIIGRTVTLLQGAPGAADAQRIVKRLLKHDKEIFRFLYDPRIEPTNNEAERALRPSVVKRKTSYGSRRETGARNHTILTTIVQTAERQGRGAYETIRGLVTQSPGTMMKNKKLVRPSS